MNPNHNTMDLLTVVETCFGGALQFKIEGVIDTKAMVLTICEMRIYVGKPKGHGAVRACIEITTPSLTYPPYVVWLSVLFHPLTFFGGCTSVYNKSRCHRRWLNYSLEKDFRGQTIDRVIDDGAVRACVEISHIYHLAFCLVPSTHPSAIPSPNSPAKPSPYDQRGWSMGRL